MEKVMVVAIAAGAVKTACLLLTGGAALSTCAIAAVVIFTAAIRLGLCLRGRE